MQASNSSLHRRATLPALVALIATIVLGTALSLASTPSEASAKPSLGGTLSGSTSQGNPGRIKVSSNGRMIREVSITITVKCPVGPFLLPQKARSISITPSGRFKGTLEDTSEAEGITLHIFESLSGKFNADRTSVNVKSRLRLNFQAPDGTAEACDSGPVTLHATR
jgi:hypothetical protein